MSESERQAPKTPGRATAGPAAWAELVIFIDVDNTLLDNDRIQADIRQHLEQEYGPA